MLGKLRFRSSQSLLASTGVSSLGLAVECPGVLDGPSVSVVRESVLDEVPG